MSEEYYKCICGRTFDKPNSFNGHKSHCKEHQIAKHGSLEFYKQVKTQKNEKIAKTALHNAEINRNTDNERWVSEQHHCEACGKIMTEKYGSGRFCCKSCANRRVVTDQIKQRMSDSVKVLSKAAGELRHKNSVDLYDQNPNKCVICGCILDYDSRNHKVCDNPNCKHECLSRNGRKSVYIQGDSRRSKSEVYFYELCKNYFKDVEHNIPIFDGWDADIIIHDIKYAILWNGIWHYKKIKNNQSLEQIQNRDSIKIAKIIEYGYTPYIIKQSGTFNENFIEEKFNELVSLLTSS